MTWDAVILGGGCAGLSAATSLAEKGHKVLVIERKRMFGGRASSFVEKETAQVVDNGQHLMLGCYTFTLEYLRRIGSFHLLQALPNLSTPICGIDGSSHALKVGNLPAPFHLLKGLLIFKALPLSDRLKFFKLPFLLKQKNLNRLSAYDWLQQLHQSPIAYQRFWEILILATLNADPKTISADMLAVVLKDGFMDSKEKSTPLLSKVGLSQLFGEPAETYLTQRNGKVIYQQVAQKLSEDDHRVTSLELLSGDRIESKCFISALPPHFLMSLCERSSPRMKILGDQTRELSSSPILSLNIWTDDPIIDEPYAGMWGTKFHWIFKKEGYYTLVASASFDLLHEKKDSLLELARHDIQGCFQKNIHVKHFSISWEKTATWIAPIGKSNSRLDQATPWSNFLCGDWTNTQLPGTIESAFKSGAIAAKLASNYLTT